MSTESDTIRTEHQTSDVDINIGELLGKQDDAMFESLLVYRRALKNDYMESRAKNKSSFEKYFSREYSLLYDLAAACYVYFYHTLNIESFLVVLNAVGVTIFYMYFQTSASQYLACKLDFSILSFAVVFPLTFLLQQAFTRREQALVALADIKALLVNASVACFTWDFPNSKTKEFNGRDLLPENFDEDVLRATTAFLKLLYEFLSMPTVSRAKNYVFQEWIDQRHEVFGLQDQIIQSLAKVQAQQFKNVEVLKAAGLPANEASRINQYHWFLSQRFELLRNIKYYRTPQASRSFGRFYIFVLPWFFGPYFAYVAGLQVSSNGSVVYMTNVGFGCALAGFTFLVLNGLINAGRRMEDPFSENEGYDNIHLQHDIACATQVVVFHFQLAERERRRRKNEACSKKEE